MTTHQAFLLKPATRQLGRVIVFREGSKLRIAFNETSISTPSRWAETERGAKSVISRWLKETAKPGYRSVVEVDWRLA